jgi:5'-nucleotidase
VAPESEQSARGTAITLHEPLAVKRVVSRVASVSAYAVTGTASDSVILALAKLIKEKIDIVVSGINQGPNLGDDVLISGTVGAALQAYLRGIPAIAISLATAWQEDNSPNQHVAAGLAALLCRKVYAGELAANIFLSINLPDLPLEKIRGIRVTHLAQETHSETVEEVDDAVQTCYWMRRHIILQARQEKTDIAALEQDYISVTSLHNLLSRRCTRHINDRFSAILFQELQEKGRNCSID